MLFGVSMPDAIQAIGVLGILSIVFAESGMMVGFFLPGDTLLFSAGFLAQQNVLGVSVHVLVLLIFIAAVLGDNLGYIIGLKFGRRLFSKPHSLVFHKGNLHKAERFYEKYGAITVMIARFVPVLRTFGPIAAGISKMHYPAFLFFDILGSLAWSASITYLGYFGGAFLQSKGIDVESLVLPVVALATIVTFSSPVYEILKDPKRRQIVLRRLGWRRGSKVD
jgi:membrane-associated protein